MNSALESENESCGRRAEAAGNDAEEELAELQEAWPPSLAS
jgi:hypothetical protein